MFILRIINSARGYVDNKLEGAHELSIFHGGVYSRKHVKVLESNINIK